jgi:hypothetical protein
MRDNDDGLHAMGGGIFLVLGSLFGFCNSGKEKLQGPNSANLQSGTSASPAPNMTPEPSHGLNWVLAQPAGSIFMGAVGLLGVLYLAFKLRGKRAWIVLVLGYFIDQMLTVIFALPIMDSFKTAPLGIGPSILGAFATFCAGAFAGFFAPHVPLRVAFGLVSIDSFVCGFYGFVSPWEFSLWLVFRVFAAYAAAGFGAAIGQYALISFVKKRLSIGKFLAKSAFACGTAVFSGVLTALIIKHIIK